MAYRLKRELICYRIADRRFPLFSGEHAAQVGGRWNPRGRPAIYACTTYSGAMLEKLAQLGTTRIPRYQAAITITIPAGLTVEAYKEDLLPAGWNASDYETGQALGEKWLIAQKAVVLIVPSVLFPVEQNVVLNPSHPQAARILVGEPMQLRWDERLFAKTKRRSE
ncbi:MAG: RES domain-containing protein [Burkholderiales bacterium]